MMNGHDLDIGVMLGRLLQGQAHSHQRLAKIDRSIETISTRIGVLETAHRKSKASRPEIWIKTAIQVLLPLGVLWLTGSVEMALKFLEK